MVRENLFDEELGFAVGVGALPYRVLFCDGQEVGRAVHSGTAGKDDVGDIVFTHALDDVHCRYEVGLVVQQRLLHTLVHCLQSGEVDHTVKMVLKNNVKNTELYLYFKKYILVLKQSSVLR